MNLIYINTKLCELTIINIFITCFIYCACVNICVMVWNSEINIFYARNQGYRTFMRTFYEI